jgi:hypothetical protein
MDNKDFDVQCGTGSNGHHLFGFHDLIAFNKKGDKLLSLELDVINRPPLPGEKAGVGYSVWEEGRFVKLGETNAYNFPQGARQQWLSDTTFIVNNQVGKEWGAEIYDVDSGAKVEEYTSTAHCVMKNSQIAFGIDYSRLHRLGGYGYIGIEDSSKNESIPKGQGIWKLDINTKQKSLMISIAEIAECDVQTSAANGYHHYVTHLVLNPSNTRIAFLHRFFLSDGGIRTRLMTVSTDGTDLRCIAVGFLSHFDWKDDLTVFVWGRSGGGLDALRSNVILSSPLMAPFIRLAKGVVRKVISKTSNQLSMSFLLVRDTEETDIRPVAEGVITEDGHPMFNPVNRNIIVNDTYPSDEKFRTLMLYFFKENARIDLAKCKMIDERPDTLLFKEYTQGCDVDVLNLMTPELFSFTRSGLHCDFHPRWNADGTMVAFDSIHEGTRQIYVVDVSSLVHL